MKRHPRSIRTQLVFWNILILALLLGALGLVVRYMVRSTIMASVNGDLERRTRHFGPGPGPGPLRDERRPDFPRDFGPPPDGFGHLPERWRRQPEAEDLSRPRTFDLNGQSTGPSQEPLWDKEAFLLAKQGQTIYASLTLAGQPYQIISRPVPGRGPIRMVVQAAYPLTEVNRTFSGLNRALLTLIPVALLCAGLGGAVLTDRVLRRVRRMTLAAGHISAHNFSERLPVTGNDEFSELAETFNGLLGRLEGTIQQQRRFTADASHELKTPLTIIKGNAGIALKGRPSEASYRQSIQEIEQAAETMSHLVQDLLLLARSDDGQLGRDRIELLIREVLDQAISRIAPQADAPMRLNVAEETLCVLGNEEELTRLFANLLDNAARYTPSEGQITVTARRAGKTIEVTVMDTGSGIAPEHLRHLGERFYRVDRSRSRPDGGTGLGLSICKSIVTAHQGIMTFESALGIGTTVHVTLPAAPLIPDEYGFGLTRSADA